MNLQNAINQLKLKCESELTPDKQVAMRNDIRDAIHSLEEIDFPDGKDHLLLKWGTLKSWNFNSEEGKELLKQYFALGSSMGAMQQKDTQEQKELICKMIDVCDSPIREDWGGTYMTKQEAKEYVLEYGKKS
jgi:hypothetical protein